MKKRLSRKSKRRLQAFAVAPSAFLLCFLLLAACSEKPKGDACCSVSGLPSIVELEDDQGALQVEGSTRGYFYVLDERGNQVAYQRLNQTLHLNAGRYTVKINNTVHAIDVYEGMLSKCSTGTLVVAGSTPDYYNVSDTLNQQLGNQRLGKSLSFFPGLFHVQVNNTQIPVEVKLRELTTVRTGALMVRGNTAEYYYVLDGANKQLAYNVFDKPLAFLPGTYLLKVNNTSLTVDVFAGEVTEARTGNLLVKGLTEEYYYVTDTAGNALNYQNLNKPLAFFPGNFLVRVNNTVVAANISEGQTAEFATGGLILTGGGTEYYYVLDQMGNPLNYNSLNKSLSFFPSEYVVKLGESTRNATVKAGQLTAVDFFP